MTLFERIKNRKIGVLGMARSGLAVARLVKQFGGRVFLSDSAQAGSLASEIAELKELEAEFEVGGHTDILLESEYIILSPGVPDDIDILKRAKNKGIPVFSEIEFGSWFVKGDIIAVTGSNGKTTTATMIDHILQQSGYDSVLCGNIGTPISAVAAETTRNTAVVVEVSSYQLERIEQFSPRIAVITNVTPDHLDRHGTLENYRAAKLRVTENQSDSDALILNAGSATLDCQRVATDAKRICFGRESTLTSLNMGKQSWGAWERDGFLFVSQNADDVKLCRCDELQIPGWHNVENALAASAALYQFGVRPEDIASALKSFVGVEHRIEFIGAVDGVKFVNDSKATNIDALERALDAIATPVRLILGGRGKGEDFSRLTRYATSPIASIAAIGESREEIFASLGKAVPVSFADSIQTAVQTLWDESREGETILLSPACASFDMFKNFEERGREFKKAFESLKAGRRRDVLKS